ncbi:Organ specific protein [Sesbania bispinosa]|nr:Organ specific protein [Sesbania bispinosa]
MRSLAHALLPFFCLVLFVANVESRKDPAGEYWKMVMKDQDMPEGIQGLVNFNSEKKTLPAVEGSKHNCDEEPLVKNTQVTIEKKVFVEDFEPRPNVSAYEDDDIDAKEKKKVVKDFEPRPNVSAYGDDDKNDAKEKKKYVKDFEPRPNVSAYGDDEIDSKDKEEIRERL